MRHIPIDDHQHLALVDAVRALDEMPSWIELDAETEAGFDITLLRTTLRQLVCCIELDGTRVRLGALSDQILAFEKEVLRGIVTDPGLIDTRRKQLIAELLAVQEEADAIHSRWQA